MKYKITFLMIISSLYILSACTTEQVAKNESGDRSVASLKADYEKNEPLLKDTCTFSAFTKTTVRQIPKLKDDILGNLSEYKTRNNAAIIILENSQTPKKEMATTLSNIIKKTEASIKLQSPYLAYSCDKLSQDLSVSVKLLKDYARDKEYNNAVIRLKDINREISEISEQVTSI